MLLTVCFLAGVPMPERLRCGYCGPGEAVGCIIHTEGRCRHCRAPRCHRHLAEHEERCPEGPRIDPADSVALTVRIRHADGGCPYGDLSVVLTPRGPVCAHCGASASPEGPEAA